MAVDSHHNALGRHCTVQVSPQDADAQAMDAALREARNWAALRSVSVFQCPVTATVRLAVTSPMSRPAKTPTPGRWPLQALADLLHALR